ncbi:MAG: hypothetical protein H0W73_03140 [Bacteroidetes bacterium]|nr:hypothetical protein [Bacteroidota bacterium]
MVLLFFAVLFIVPDKEFLFKNALGDCSGRAQFMYNALYTDKKEADVVLFGSSRIMNGVYDSAFGKNKILNLGYCRFGRNLDAFFIEEYLKTHQPKKIILEVRSEEGSNSHPLTPFLMPVSKIANDFYTLDGDVISNLYNKWLCNLKFTRSKIFTIEDATVFETKVQYGFWANLTDPDLIAITAKRVEDSLELLTETPQKKMNRNSEFYFEKIKKACDEKNVKLYFLYIPSFGNVYKRPALQKEYLTYATCIIPPDSVFCNSSNFADYNHLNKNGARQLSIWFNNYLESR